jgi:hypothetical protein
MRLVPTSEGPPTPDRPGPSATEDPTVAQSSTGSDEQPRRSSPISRPQMIVAAVVVVLLAGVLTVLLTRGSSHRTAQPSPTPDINGLITRVPAIYPVVQAQLAAQTIPLSLIPNDSLTCTQIGYVTPKLSPQLCTWAQVEPGSTHDAELSVTVTMDRTISAAHADLVLGPVSRDSFAPQVTAKTHLSGLGDEALVGRIDRAPDTRPFPGQVVGLSGAEVGIRVRNVNVLVIWVGADYTPNASGTGVSSVTGLPYQQGRTEAINIAKAIVAHVA